MAEVFSFYCLKLVRFNCEYSLSSIARKFLSTAVTDLIGEAYYSYLRGRFNALSQKNSFQSLGEYMPHT